jgi:predicted ATPase
MPPETVLGSEILRVPREMVGREAELQQLQGALDKALRGERQLVIVSGEPGIGKTTLLDTFVGQLAGQHGLWIARGQCLEQYGAGEAYLPILEALGRVGREAGGEEVVATLAQYAPTWLAQLLQHPNQDCHALTLVSGGEITAQAAASGEQGDAEEGGLEARGSLDVAAQAAYKRQLEELQAELEEARAFNDVGRIEKVQEAIEEVTQELLHALELKDRTRTPRSPVERARLMVTKAIRLAIKKIDAHHPSLGEHLTRTIKTDTVCAYVPDPQLSIVWQV